MMTPEQQAAIAEVLAKHLNHYMLAAGGIACTTPPAEVMAMTGTPKDVTCPACKARIPEPSSCTGTAHEHRWLKFRVNGERLTYVVHVDAAGHVDISEQAIDELLTEAGFRKHDPDQVEQAAQRRKFRALERLRAGLMDSLNGRAR